MSFVLNQFKTMIFSRFGKDAASVWSACINQTKELEKEFPYVRKDIRKAIYPIAGIYIAMQEYVSADEAKKILIDYAPTIGNKLRKIIYFGTSVPGVSAYMWKNIESIMHKAGSEAKGYKSRFYGKNGDVAAMDVLECPLHEAFKMIGIPEITSVVCAMDLIYSTGYKGIDFTRTKALGNGDACCDYRYRKINALRKVEGESKS